MVDEPASPRTDSAAAVPPRRIGLVALVAVGVLVLDQLSKTWAVRRLTDGRTIDVVWTLRFNLLHNSGVAFSKGSGRGLGPWISLLALVVVAGVALWSPSRRRLGAVAAGLVVGGAIGNLLDRAFRGDAGFLHGEVVDFIDLQWWPVFNVADMGVVVGAILLVLAALLDPDPHPEPEPEPEPDSEPDPDLEPADEGER